MATRLLILALVFLASPAPVAALDASDGPVVLTLTGNIGATNSGDRAEFDLDMLEAMSDAEFTTTTPWTEGRPTFAGPLLETVLNAVDARGTTLDAVALNEYFVTIDIGKAVGAGAMIAVRMDGERMPIREKGPAWIVFSYDAEPELASDLIKNWSIWQLKSIHVK